MFSETNQFNIDSYRAVQNAIKKEQSAIAECDKFLSDKTNGVGRLSQAAKRKEVALTYLDYIKNVARVYFKNGSIPFKTLWFRGSYREFLTYR